MWLSKRGKGASERECACRAQSEKGGKSSSEARERHQVTAFGWLAARRQLQNGPQERN